MVLGVPRQSAPLVGLSVGGGVDWLLVEREGKGEAIWKTEVSEEDE